MTRDIGYKNMHETRFFSKPESIHRCHPIGAVGVVGARSIDETPRSIQISVLNFHFYRSNARVRIDRSVGGKPSRALLLLLLLSLEFRFGSVRFDGARRASEREASHGREAPGGARRAARDARRRKTRTGG